MTSDQTTILLVDDEDIVLRAVERHLAAEPYQLITASSARNALDILERTPVQVLVSDFRMPDMDGGELLKIAAERWPDTVRMVLSGYADLPSVISAINEGEIFRFISKPWQGTELKATIRSAVERYQQQMETRRLAEAALALNNELLSAHMQSVQKTSERNLHLESAAEELMVYKQLFRALDVPLILCRGAECVEANPSARRLFLKGKPFPADGNEELVLLPESLRRAVESFAGESKETERLIQCLMESGEAVSARLCRVQDGFSSIYIAVSLSSCANLSSCPAPVLE